MRYMNWHLHLHYIYLVLPVMSTLSSSTLFCLQPMTMLPSMTVLLSQCLCWSHVARWYVADLVFFFLPVSNVALIQLFSHHLSLAHAPTISPDVLGLTAPAHYSSEIRQPLQRTFLEQGWRPQNFICCGFIRPLKLWDTGMCVTLYAYSKRFNADIFQEVESRKIIVSLVVRKLC